MRLTTYESEVLESIWRLKYYHLMQPRMYQVAADTGLAVRIVQNSVNSLEGSGVVTRKYEPRVIKSLWPLEITARGTLVLDNMPY